MMELRMLSGLHRGALLELDDEELTLGASEQADVIVADPDVAALHLRVCKESAGYFLMPHDGVVLAEDGQPVGPALLLAPGMRFKVGEAWIGFFLHQDAWVAPPLDGAAAAPAGPVPLPAPEAPDSDAPGENRPRRRLPRSTIVLVGTLFVTPLLIWLSACAYAGFGPPALASALRPAAKNVVPVPPAPPPNPAAAEAQRLLAHRALLDRLGTEFKHQLAQRELLERVDIELADTGWHVRGALDAEEHDRLTRVVNSFAEANRLPFQVRVTVVPQKDMLPFEIVEVSSGRNGNVVTGDGQRLFVGDTLEGYRLLSVAPAKIVFAGKRRIELTW